MVGEVLRLTVADKVVGGCCGSTVMESSSEMADSQLHVLAVDDSHVDRKIIERLLRISSCKVTSVESGMRALQFLGLDQEDSNGGFNDINVNLIMTDYSMPGMSGYELLKKIKGSAAFREVPVVIMSSENVMTRVDKCLEEGAQEFIMKPVKLSDVRRLKECVSKGDVLENPLKRKNEVEDSAVASKKPKMEVGE